MRKTLLFTLLSLVYWDVYGQNKPNKLDQPFHQLLKEVGATFVMPEGFQEVAVSKASKVIYQYAIKEPASGFEVRYFIRPFKLSNTESLSKETFVSTILNAVGNSSRQIPHIDEFQKRDVKNDFNADWGATSAFQPLSIFGIGFKLCSVQVLKKDKIGEIYTFWMINDPLKEQAFMLKTFSSVKFNP